MKDIQWHKLTIRETLNSLGTKEEGLSIEEPSERLKKFGPNQIKEEKKTPAWLLFLGQFKSFLIVILIIASC